MGELSQTKNVIVARIPFLNYGYVLKDAHFTVCNTKGYATWNMAVLDSQFFGTEVVSCDTPLMREFRTFTTDDFAKTFNLLLDKPKLQPHQPNFDDFDLQNYLEREITKRVYDKNPAKYEDVKGLIENFQVVEKRQFVNQFWSFHANSNFQLIRWKLLTEGINDMTERELTTYNIM